MFLRLLVCLVFLLPASLLADDWDALKQPGAIALMRHALAPGGGDPEGFTLGDCATQRNLDARGPDQARRIGGDRLTQTAETLNALSALPDDSRALLVTHQVNITALTGVMPQSGEIIVARMLNDGTLEVSGRVNIAP